MQDMCMTNFRSRSQMTEPPENSSPEMLRLAEKLSSLERMAELPSVDNLICILQMCRKKKNLAYAKRLHSYICNRELETHKAVGNYLVPMLVECGDLPDAQQIFNKLSHRNQYSWNSLIFGHIECGELQLAFHLYKRMQEDSVQPDNCTFLALLKACARLKYVDGGLRIYAEIAKKGLEKDLFLGSTVVDMFGKCGAFAEAWRVFDKLPVQNVVLWNALIAGYAERGLEREVLNCIECMELDGVSPDAITFICSLKACASTGAIESGQRLCAEIAKKGLETDLFVGSKVVDMFSKCGLLAEAREVFDKLQIRNVVTWNALIAGYADCGLGEEGLHCFKQMQWEGVSPDAGTFVGTLKACGSVRAIERGRELCAEIAQEKMERDLFVGTTVVDMFGKCGLLAEAQDMFQRLSFQSVVPWNALIACFTEHGLGKEALICLEEMEVEGVSPNGVTFVCSLKACGNIGDIQGGLKICDEITKKGWDGHRFIGNMLVDMFGKCGSLAEAREVFDKLLVQDVVSWNVLITRYTENGLGEEALNSLELMQLDGVSPDAVTFVSCLKACGSIGAIDRGQEIHTQIVIDGLEKDAFIGSILVDMYGKCGLLVDAQEVFYKLPVPDVTSWSAMIQGYGLNHEGNMVVECFEGMQEQGAKLDATAFTCVLAACSHTSLVNKGQEYFNVMRKHEIEPTINHHSCMVDLLARSGYVYQAERFVENMGCAPSKEMWLALLSACKIYGDIGLGLRCFHHLVQMNPEDAPAYVLIGDIHASAGRFDDANRMEELRKHVGAKKKPANALIEVNKQVHEFVVGNNQSKEILEMIETLCSRIKGKGYVPNLDLILRCISYGKEAVSCDDVDKYSYNMPCQKSGML